MTTTLFFFLCLCSVISHNVDGIQDTLKEDLEYETKPNLINKTPIKTIYTKFGDIIDCVDIYKQPALDHPLLKNHKLQIKPNFENLIEKTFVNNSQIGSMFGLDGEECPPGTVPIHRVRSVLSEEKILKNHILSKNLPGLQHAETYITRKYGPFYKVSGTTSIYNPKVEKGQVSMVHIWVENGHVKSSNRIIAGWHSDDFQKTGCYNTKCRGFVQVDTKNFPGKYFADISKIGGPTYETYMAITQDNQTKNWWISLGNVSVGYYPAALFSNLGSASIVGWGGRTRANTGGISPPMGSGHFPDGNKARECYFSSPKVQDASRKDYTPASKKTKIRTDNTSCYSIYYYNKPLGVIFDEGIIHFGGPGGMCGI
ncbi:uncharacterized protein LOC114182502 isoform X2 [Vigna unguiculata]|uniref:uncharacterized protein LOC114182502 isoform X2 n=1 Tax=Vigna unguiculata TaxID=3917 RepID=UPI0010171084|nr:uncharacterized protein LOC114182502 isoform X2 [Vigna unguiculata]